MGTELERFGDFTKRFYLPARPYGLALFRLYFRLRAIGLEHIPQTGPVVLVPNHSSFLDPPLLSAVVPRVIYFLMLHHHFYHRWWHWLFSRLPCIPVKRGRALSTAGLRESLQVLRHGQILCVFPEGGISRQHKSGGAKHGAALLAAKVQAPLVPAGIQGADKALGLHQRFPRPRRITIHFGKPLYVPAEGTKNKTILQEFTDMVMQDLQSLQRGVG